MVEWDKDRVAWGEKAKNRKVLCRMLEKVGDKFQEVELIKGGSWAPTSVFAVRSVHDIESVEGELA